jgi:adenylate cyclase
MPTSLKTMTRPDGLFAGDDARWEAILARDARADGRFWYGVATTGIYCRPTCTARRPLRRNVSFHATREAAAAHGLRPCKMCRPETAPRPRADHLIAVRHVAVMFVDVKGFTRLAAQLLPEDALATLASLHATLGAIVAARGGVVHRHLGDGFMALFGRDKPRPDDARRAVTAALAMRPAVAARNAGQAAAGGPLKVGIGVHYGMAAFGRVGGERTVIGDTINLASRLERATRRLDTDLLVSDDALRAIPHIDAPALRRQLYHVGLVRLPDYGMRRVWSAGDAVAGRRPQGERRATA